MPWSLWTAAACAPVLATLPSPDATPATPVCPAAPRLYAVDAPPAKLPVRTHEVVIVDGMINVVLDDAPPNLPPGVTTKAARGEQ